MKKLLWLFGLLIAFAIFSFSLGSAEIDGVWRYVFNPDFNSTSVAHKIIWEIRFPRAIAAILIGALLGIAGVLAQGATNNPLADPAIIATSAGASLGVVIGILLNVAEIGSLTSVIFATVGALAATLAVFALARSVLQLIIIGIGVSAVLTSIVGLALSLASRPDARSVSFWSFGSFSLVTSDALGILLPALIIAVMLSWLLAPNLDLLSLGDASVRHLGFNPKRIRLKIFSVFAAIIAVSVSTVGTVSFLALATPHIARKFVGPRARILIPTSGLLGGVILLIADTAARAVVPPTELPIGLITSIIGAPILIIAVRKSVEVWR